MQTREEILDFLRANKVFLKTEFHIIKIGLFGSYARNEQTYESDVDILFELESNTRNIFHIKRKLKEYFQKELNRKVDICREKAIRPIFKEYIINETIYV